MAIGGAVWVAVGAYRLVADDHTALEQKLLDVAQDELKPKIPAHLLADCSRRKSMAVIQRLRLLHPASLRHRQRDNADQGRGPRPRDEAGSQLCCATRLRFLRYVFVLYQPTALGGWGGMSKVVWSQLQCLKNAGFLRLSRTTKKEE